MNKSTRKKHELTLRLYPVYAFLSHTYFWLPVFILFFLKYLPLEQILLLEAIYYAGVVILEIPSGYFSDRVGRRATLLISTIALTIAYTIFFSSSTFVAFALAQIFLAIGLSFNSGTDTSMHYDALAALNRDHEFGSREAYVSKLTFYAGALGAICGGLAGLYDPRMAYLLAVMASAVAFVIVVYMTEPVSIERRLVPQEGFLPQIRRIIHRISHPIVCYVFAFYVLMTILNHIPYEFYQPYIENLLVADGLGTEKTSMLSGLHVALTMLTASWFAGQSIQLRNRVGLHGLFLLAAGLQTLLIVLMAFFTSWIVILLLLLRSVPRAVMTAPVNATIAPLFKKEHRATYFSLQSLAGRLAFSLTLVAFSAVTGLLPGNPLQNSLALGAVIGVSGILGLLIIEQVGHERRQRRQ